MSKPNRFIDLKYAELHDTMFLGGANLGDKLDPKKRTGLVLKWDTEEKALIVTYNGEAYRTDTNCKGAIPQNPADFGVTWLTEAIPAPVRVKTVGHVPMRLDTPERAQISDPSRGMK